MKRLTGPQLFCLLILALGGVYFGVQELRHRLRSHGARIQARLEQGLGSLERRTPAKLGALLSDDFVDESSSYRRRDVLDAARAAVMPGARYRILPLGDGDFVFESGPEQESGVYRATAKVRCDLQVRYGPEQPYSPFWDLQFTADFELRHGRWMVVRTRDVNHDRSPLR